MKKIFFFLTVLFLVSSPARAEGDIAQTAYDRVIAHNTLRCGVMLWPPYFERDLNTKQFKGFGVEFYGAMAQMLDIKIEYVEIVIGQQVEDLKNKKIDAVCNDGPYVFSAMKFLDYTMPAYYGPIYVFVGADNSTLKSVEDLNKQSVRFIGMDGDISSDLVSRRFPDATLLSLPATSDAASLMLHVATGKADALYIDPAPVKAFNATNKSGLKMIMKDSPVVYPVGISVAKGEQELLNMLNYGIAALWNTNGALPILRKYDPDGGLILPLAKPYELKN